MGESENVELVKRSYAALSKGDIAGCLGAFAGDARWNHPTVKDVPYAGPCHGRDEIRGILEKFDELEEPVDCRQNEFHAWGDRVIVLGTYKGRIKATGRAWQTRFVHAATIRAGKLQEVEFYFDTAALAEAYRE